MQTAMKTPMMAAERSGIVMLAKVARLRALNAGTSKTAPNRGASPGVILQIALLRSPGEIKISPKSCR
jgi:hypothetical protein